MTFLPDAPAPDASSATPRSWAPGPVRGKCRTARKGTLRDRNPPEPRLPGRLQRRQAVPW